MSFAPAPSVKGSVGAGYGRPRSAIIRDRRSPVREVMTRVAYAGGVAPSGFCLMEDTPSSVTETRGMLIRGVGAAGAVRGRATAVSDCQERS